MTETEHAVEIFAIVQFGIIGLSHLAQPRAWVDFFVLLRQKGHAGVFATAFLSLIFGSIVVAFHNVWSGPSTILTVIGWGQVLKSALYFVFPKYGLRQLQLPSPERAWHFQLAGLFFLVLSALLGFDLLAVG